MPLPVSGTSQTPPQCEVTPTTIDFDSVTVTQTADKTFTIKNTGGGTLSGRVSESCSELTIVGGKTYSLGTGQSTSFTVRFSPTTPGDKSCTIAPGAECADVSVIGIGRLALTSQARPGP